MRARGQWRWLLVTGGLSLPPALAGQSPAQRRDLAAFLDSVTALSDTTALRAFEVRLMRAAKRERSSPYLHLTLGHLALRLGRLGGAGHYDDAASEFKWATELAPQWPYAWYGLGLAELAVGDVALARRERVSLLAKEAWPRATSAFARAIILENGFAFRLETLARAAARDGDVARALTLEEALRRAGLRSRSRAPMHLVQARIRLELGDTAAALDLLPQLLEGEYRAPALLELARIRLTAGDPQGIELYYTGVAVDDSAAAAGYRADLAPIATLRELLAFDSAGGAARAQWVRRFWTERDRRDLRDTGERLREHYRRLALARRQFAHRGPAGDSVRLDDRGRIFVRHGEPDDRVTADLPGVAPNESWRYRRATGDLVLHFAAAPLDSAGGYRLVSGLLGLLPGNLADPPGPTAAPASPAFPAPNLAELLVQSRSRLGPFYQPAPGAGTTGRPEPLAAFLARERALVQRSIQAGLSSDSHELRFERELVGRVSPTAIGMGQSGPALQVFYALPASTFEQSGSRGESFYPLRLRFVAWDSTGTVASTLDTALTIRRFASATADLPVLGRFEVRLAAGRYSYRMALQSGDRAGVTFPPDTLRIAGPPPGGGPGLALSDLVLGGTPTSLPWSSPLGDQVSVDPAAVFGRSTSMQLAAEVYGPAAGAKLRARAFVALLGSPAGTPLKWRSFPGASGWKRFSPGVSPVPSVGRLRLDFPLKKLAPGRYLLELLVTDEHNHSARGRRIFEVTAVEP